MKITSVIVYLVTFAFLISSYGIGQEKVEKKEPEKKITPEFKEAEAKVIETEGKVEARTPERPKWFVLKVGAILRRGAEIMTGLASRAVILLAENIKIEVKALSHIKFEDLVASLEKLRAIISMDFGKLSTKVKKGVLSADLRVAVRSSTTLIKGTEVEIFSQPDVPPGWFRGLKIGWEKKACPRMIVICGENEVVVENPDTGFSCTVSQGERTDDNVNLPQFVAADESNMLNAPPPAPEFIPLMNNDIPMPTDSSYPIQDSSPYSTNTVGSQTGETSGSVSSQQSMLPEPPGTP
jgi:hypothetical protein